MRLLFSFLLFTFYFATTAQIPSYVPTNGLVGWWPFDGNANDESGNGNNGVVNGATLTVDRFGGVNKAYHFDGEYNTNIHVALTQPIQGTKTFSIWIKLPIDFINPYSQLITADYTMYDYLSINGNSPDYFAANVVGYFWDGKAYQMSLNRLNDLIWHNIVVVHNFQLLQSQVYVDGVFNSAGTSSNYQTNLNLSDFTFGSCYASAQSPEINATVYGELDDIGIWNRALTSQEITQLYTSVITPSISDDTTSNVGIGTTSPKRKLHVNDVMRLEPRDTAPANPAKGDIYFDGVLNKLRYYNGTSWISL